MTFAMPENIHSTNLVNARRRGLSPVPSNEFVSGSSGAEILRAKLEDKSALVGVIGLGYVGLPLSMTVNNGGFKVLGFEKSSEKVKFLEDGVSYIQDVPSKDVKKYLDSKFFQPTENFQRLSECDVILICVPTPLAKTGDPDMSYIAASIDSLAPHIREGQLVVLESTTYPGTTKEMLLPQLEEVGRRRWGEAFSCGRDFFIAFSPERVDPGNEKFNTFNTPKVVGGISETCGDLASIFYSKFLKTVVRVSSAESAEMVKLLENTFRAVNIGLVNEVALMCEKLGIDCWEVIEAAASKPFGYMAFYPGPGLGGHCIPIDPSYLSWKLRGLNYTARFIELAREINSGMPSFCVNKVVAALNLDRKSVNGSKVLILGVAYKKDIDDVRESPAIDIIHQLEQRGASVDYADPFIPELNYEGIRKSSISWTASNLASYDCVVVVTDHTEIDYSKVLEGATRIVDARNALKAFKSDKIVKL
jgi:UDP-N-acetyl-D-glucosamine dehydrogenase